MDKARMEFIRSLEGVELAPLPRRFDTQPIQFDALRVCICDECGAEAQRVGRKWHRGFLCQSCRDERDRKTRDLGEKRRAMRPAVMAALTRKWATVPDVMDRVGGVYGPSAVQGVLRRMFDDGEIEGCDMRIGGRMRRCYRRKRSR